MKTINIEDHLYEDLQNLASLHKIEIGKLLEDALQKSFTSMKEKYVMELYQNGKITLAKGAEILSIDIWEMIEKIRKLGLHLDYGEEELREDICQ
ncbi:MAG: UPF0175 family protein [Nitrospirota bacterium]